MSDSAELSVALIFLEGNRLLFRAKSAADLDALDRACCDPEQSAIILVNFENRPFTLMLDKILYIQRLTVSEGDELVRNVRAANSPLRADVAQAG